MATNIFTSLRSAAALSFAPPEVDNYATTIPADIANAAPHVASRFLTEALAYQDVERDFFARAPGEAAVNDYKESHPSNYRVPQSSLAKPTISSRLEAQALALLNRAQQFVAPKPVYGILGNHQVAAPGFRVPIKAYLQKELLGPLQKSTARVQVHFYAVDPTGQIVSIGSAFTDPKGKATTYFAPELPGEYKIFYQLEQGAIRTRHEFGTLKVLPPDKPYLALDMKWLVEKEGLDAVVDFIKREEELDRDRAGGYRLMAIVSSEAERQKYLEAGLGIPIIVNDYDSSPFRKKRCGFGETQLEKLKRLKFECGLPIVGVLGRPFREKSSYDQAKIEPIRYDSNATLRELQSTILADKLDGYYADFKRRAAQSKEKLFWDGMTGSEEIAGNHVEFQKTNKAAAEELFRLIDSAHSFIHIANYVFHNDEFGSKVLERLIERAKEGIKVRMIVDRMSHGPLPTDKGFSYLDFEILKRLEAAGVEIAYHEMFQKSDDDQATRGLLVRRHRKILVVDVKKDENSEPEIVSHGGGRIIGSMSYDDMRLDANWFWRDYVNIGRGSFEDLNYTIYGPVNAVIQKRFLDDFIDYGGRSPSSDLADLLRIPPSYPQNTPLRYTTHESFLNQNCHNILMHLIKNPDSKTVTLVNSFYPTQEIIDALMAAAWNGKDVTIYFSLFWWQVAKRMKLIPKLVQAGINVKIVPYQLHVKLYGDDFNWDTGNQNLEGLSLNDTEDLFNFIRFLADGNFFEGYVAELEADVQNYGVNAGDAYRILEGLYGTDFSEKDVVEFLKLVPNTRPITHTEFSHHGVRDALIQTVKFAKITIESGGWAALRGASKILHLSD